MVSQARRYVSSLFATRYLLFARFAICYSLSSYRRHLGDQLVDQRLTEGVEVLRGHHEGARAADHVLAVVILETAGRVGGLRVPGERGLAPGPRALVGRP